jgi:UDP-glucuronate 4-epimerase
MRILVTGAAGFIGSHLSERLLREGHTVVGVDSFTTYYDVALKRARIARPELSGLELIEGDLADTTFCARLFASGGFDRVYHLAAQAGVRFSLDSPHSYIHSNVTGFLNVLEGLRHHPAEHAIYASSSSVYGDDSPQPFREDAQADTPVSLYAATKRTGELMASSYAHLFGTPLTGVRFFTVYGPWGRPDMAYFKFADAILAGRPLELYGDGQLARDFTAIDDVVEGLVRLGPLPMTGPRPHRVLNIGAGHPVKVVEVVSALERALGRPAQCRSAPMQPGDVTATWADTSALEALTGFRPSVTLEAGIARFARWFEAEWPSVTRASSQRPG